MTYFKLVTYLIFTSLLIKVDTLRIHGNKLRTAESILNKTLAIFGQQNGTVYVNQGVNVAYKFVSFIEYTYDTIVWNNKLQEKDCIITTSYDYLKDNPWVTFKCHGESEFQREIINELILVPDEIKFEIKYGED
ncbi:uncharacterized protein ACRADG_012844 [Cochliomyia hominivorax]